MTKDELITFIKDLEVEEELKSQLLAVVENKTEVTEDMIRTIADIVDLRADLYQDEAEAQNPDNCRYCGFTGGSVSG